jgi:hypothetical protein
VSSSDWLLGPKKETLDAGEKKKKKERKKRVPEIGTGTSEKRDRRRCTRGRTK